MKKIKEILKIINSNPRTKAIFKLALWILFFVIIFVVATFISILSPNKTTKPSNNNNQSIIKKMESISASNYEYEYSIIVNGEKIIINGSKYNDIYRGYKEVGSTIIKYQEENNNFYQIIGDYYEPINDIYGDINPALIKIDSIIELIKDNSYEQVDSNYIYNVGDKKITINNKGTNIEIINGENSYNLTYKNINSVDEIKKITE